MMPILNWLFGRHLATTEEDEQRIGVFAGIPMLGLDALASAAYGPEAALTVLLLLGSAGVSYIGPITVLIVGLLLLVYFSYRQTIAAYPTGGGSYTVARENLGLGAGLFAAAALMIDYVLVVAVGISAGVGALVSAFPSLQPYTLSLGLATLVVIAGVNLRGVRESGIAFALPTYLFVVSLFGVLGVGLIKTMIAGGHPTAVDLPPSSPPGTEAIGWWILAKAFASGCTAMTGVEAVSNGVAAFRQPCFRHAKRTLTAIVAILALLLLEIALLCWAYGIGATEPGKPGYDSVLSQLVAAIIGRGAFYYVTIGAVLIVLCLSANTGFADFPRLCRAVAQDGFLPHGFAHRGRRLVYSQGIVVLTVLSAILLIAYDGVTDNLIPLFAVGAFLAFTLSQAGMVVHWLRQPGPKAWGSVFVNGIGAAGTAAALLVVLVAKFVDGAWVTVLLMGGLVVGFISVRRHYRDVARQLTSEQPLDFQNTHQPLVVLLVRGWSRITRKALRLAIQLSPEVYAVHFAFDELRLDELEQEWTKFVAEPALAAGVPNPKLIVIPSPFRRLYAPLIEFVGDLERSHPDRQILVIVPELVERKWYHYPLHNQTAAVIKGYLYFSGLRRVAVVNVPWYLND
jgi:amino acid transporter